MPCTHVLLYDYTDMHMHVHNMHMRIQKNISRGSKGYFSLQGGMSFFWLRISGGGGGGWGRGGSHLRSAHGMLAIVEAL